MNGDVNVSGESTPSVFVMVALDGVAVYVALQVGFVTVAPSSSEPLQPVNELIAKEVAVPMVMEEPAVLQVNPAPQMIERLPVSVFSDVTPVVLLDPPPIVK